MPRESKTPEHLIIPILVAVLSALTACDGGPRSSIGDVATSLGITDPQPPPTLTTDVDCDPTSGSPCTRERFAESVDLLLPVLAERPGSELRVWLQGRDVASSRIVATATVPNYRSHRRRDRRAEQARWVASTKESLTKAMEPTWREPQPRRSPIAETLAAIARTEAGGAHERILVALTDGREVSRFGDFECAPLPPKSVFLARLDRGLLLAPGSFHGIRVLFAHFGPTPIRDRHCDVTLERTGRISDIWREALTRAGAAEVRFLALGPHLESEHPTKGDPRS